LSHFSIEGEEHSAFAVDSNPDRPPEGERWSSWDGSMHGPAPRPDWVITALGAVESDLGVLKTGKEADVHILRRWVPGDPARDVLMAAKRFRGAENRLFHRDAGYVDGRRVRRSREMRAMGRRTDFGKSLIAGQWAMAEFEALGALWALDLPVPYPVQFSDTEMLMELIVSPDGDAAPRLAQARPPVELLADLFEQLRVMMTTLALHGWATVTCRRTTSCSRASGSSSSTGPRSSTSSATRTGRSSSSGTRTTCASGSSGGGMPSTRASSSAT